VGVATTDKMKPVSWGKRDRWGKGGGDRSSIRDPVKRGRVSKKGKGGSREWEKPFTR